MTQRDSSFDNAEAKAEAALTRAAIDGISGVDGFKEWAPSATTTARQAVRSAESGFFRAQDSIAAVKRIINDDSLPRESRIARARAHVEAQAEKVAELLDAAEANADVLRASLFTAALPTMPRSADVPSVQAEFSMMAQAATDPVAFLRGLAAGDDDRLAALAVGTWGRSFLVSRGGDPADLEHVRKIAIGERAERGDSRARAAVAALDAQHRIKGYTGGQRVRARQRLEEAIDLITSAQTEGDWARQADIRREVNRRHLAGR